MGKKPLSKSIDEYLANNGWSSNLFFEHAKLAFIELKDKAQFKVGRTVIHVVSGDKTVKAYVHHNGLTKEYLTFTDEKGTVLQTFHCSLSTPEFVVSELKKLLNI